MYRVEVLPSSWYFTHSLLLPSTLHYIIKIDACIIYSLIKVILSILLWPCHVAVYVTCYIVTHSSSFITIVHVLLHLTLNRFTVITTWWAFSMENKPRAILIISNTILLFLNMPIHISLWFYCKKIKLYRHVSSSTVRFSIVFLSSRTTKLFFF